MTRVRSVKRVLIAYETVEGTGVQLHRAFGYEEVSLFDPLLMLGDFRADKRPEDYFAGFPLHPHREIETVAGAVALAVDRQFFSSLIFSNQLPTQQNQGSLIPDDEPTIYPY